ncbi:MAG TPA: tetratricopeptide repeat protein [Prolixibacteraceae bacterium]|nr:tetratricopeptide repeat protein [Prolixibacteraceae bacterium]
MKTLLSFFLLLFIAISANAQETNYADLKVTTDSPQALKLYNQGVQDLTSVKISEADENFAKAIELDPEFMMAHVMVAMGHFYDKNEAQFKTSANKAINSKATLNESEKLIQEAMKKLVENPQADVTEFGEKLVEQNPKSFFAHTVLANFQQLAKDTEGATKTYESMLTLTNDPAPVYNSLGYMYMATNQMDKAKESFEKYLQADPDNANAYDSMGDYYAKVQDLKNAQQSYMKAYEMDSTNFKISHEKADKLKLQMAGN